jgi:hypothetical protein
MCCPTRERCCPLGLGVVSGRRDGPSSLRGLLIKVVCRVFGELDGELLAEPEVKMPGQVLVH